MIDCSAAPELATTKAISDGRHIGLAGATGIGVGAIVGGGIFALAGVAFAATGPGALLAFALNGLIALLTAFSFAELATAFPESGGTYTFARKVLRVQTAFAVGWVVWFASIVATVLYALGFAAFAVVAAQTLWDAVYDYDARPAWLADSWTATGLAIAATAFYAFALMRSNAGGGQWATIGKVIVFAVLIAIGAWALGGWTQADVGSALRPFLPSGSRGLFQAMGYTFIALQGFDLIAAVGGEVRDPERNLSRAMFLSLGMALGVYLPLLFIVATVGVVPGQSIAAMSTANPETVVALAVQNYLGTAGFWLVIVAAILSMLSALHANLLAASRMAKTMARDRTLPHLLERSHRRFMTPVPAIVLCALLAVAILLCLGDLAAAGAAASLIFLVSFALVHWIAFQARRRSGRRPPFRTPLFPLVPICGGTACIALALFQGIAVPTAGLLASIWLGAGGLLYSALFGRRAGVVDAAAEATDPHLIQLRGRRPLVLVPIANPANAAAMVGVANALTPPGVGCVLLLTVVTPPKIWQPHIDPPQLLDAQYVLRESLSASFAAGLAPEALTTVAAQPWEEIARVSRLHGCESLLLGLSDVTSDTVERQMENLLGHVDCDVVVLRAPRGWQLHQARRVLVPTGGRGGHDQLRARLLGHLCRTGRREITFLQVLPQLTSANMRQRAHRALSALAADEVPIPVNVEVLASATPADTITRHVARNDLTILGLQRFHRRRKVFGDMVLHVARQTSGPLLLLCRRG
jgi:APA family basic amino acid/polyamine antiporter